MWYVIGGIVILFLALRLFTFIFGNYRATLNRVISQFVAVKQMKPGVKPKELFFEVLDRRYQEGNGLMGQMYLRKNTVKESIEAEIEGGMSVLNKYSLPVLVYSCLLIEQNSYINQRKTVDELLAPITEEIKRQGFSEYC